MMFSTPKYEVKTHNILFGVGSLQFDKIQLGTLIIINKQYLKS